MGRENSPYSNPECVRMRMCVQVCSFVHVCIEVRGQCQVSSVTSQLSVRDRVSPLAWSLLDRLD